MDYLSKIFKNRNLRNKILFILLMFVIFRIGAVIPIPGIDVSKLKSFFEGNQFLGLLSIFSGGALNNLSIMMLGVGPYITASIIMQLLTMIFPKMKEMYQEGGEAAQQKFNQYSRMMTVPLALLQGYGFLMLLQKQGVLDPLSWKKMLLNIIIIAAGSMFLMWLGELISEKHIGEGISLIIFAGILAGAPKSIQQTLIAYPFQSNLPMYLLFLVIFTIVIAGVVIINEAQRNIPVSYAKQIRGTKMYGGNSSYLPLRVNQAGVVPIIFAVSIMLFPSMIANFVSLVKIDWLAQMAKSVDSFLQNSWVYNPAYFVLVVLFTYFYTAVTFEPHKIAENLQKQGGFVPGIRPGRSTSEFLAKVMNRIILAGAVFLGIIAILPYLVKSATGIGTISMGGTALLIVVSVALDMMKQVKAQVSMMEYD